MCTRQLVKGYSDDDEMTAQRLYKENVPLFKVMRLRNAAVAKLMIEYGSEVNKRDTSTGISALHVAVRESCLDNVKVLIEHGADVNIQANDGLTPICCYKVMAADSSNLEILKLLLDSGASLYGQDNYGLTHLVYLLYYQDIETMRTLLHCNIDLNAQDHRGQTPVHQMLCTPNFVNELKDRQFDVDITDNEGRTALSYAVKYRNLEAVELLLRRDANVNSKCTAGITPLFEAFRVKIQGDKEDKVLQIVETLLHYGADVQHVSDDGHTVLDFAIQTKSFALLKPVIAHIAMLKCMGTRIEPIISTQIKHYPNIKEQFCRYRERLEIMMKCRVYGSITLFKLLSEPEEKITRYFRNNVLVSRIKYLDINCRGSTYYFRLLNQRIDKAIQRAQLRKRATLVISRITMIIGVAVEKIIDYLDEDSLLQLCEL